jgi:hypothetical protein
MRLLKRTLPLILAVPLVLGSGSAFAEDDHCARGGGGQECQGPIDNGGEGLPGPGPGVL